MIKSIYKELIILLLLFGAIWGASSYFSPEKIDPVNVSLSTETESALGDLMVHQMKSSYTVLEDSLTTEAIGIITDKLLSGLDSSEYSYTFYVLDYPQENAFATFGGNIFIFSGLIKMTDNPEELAAVLAHEIGHVEEHHVSDLLVKKYGLSVVISILTGGDPALLTEILKFGVTSSFSRDNETEADNFGLNLLEKTNINPLFMGDIFSKLKEASDESLFNGLNFISSHPDIDERILASINYNSPKQFPESSFSEIKWDSVKESLD